MNKNSPKQPKKIDYFKELVYTFSNKKSLFSSKKIERFIVFNVFLTLSIVYIVKNIDEMDSMSFIEIVGLWLFYGGYNSLMSLRDKKLHHNQDPVSEYMEDEVIDGTEEDCKKNV
jgi:hypothetical protein